ncbi:MAG: hypothetical protein WD738_11760 [Pirellulales bacterium]
MRESVDAFAWTFPLFVLGEKPAIGPGGEMSTTKETHLISAEGPGGRPHLAIFTDVDLAEEFRQHCYRDSEVWKYPLNAAPEAVRFLRSTPREIPGVLIDPNPKTSIGLVMSVAEMIQSIEAHTANE